MNKGLLVYSFSAEFEHMQRFYAALLETKPRQGGPNWCSFAVGGSEIALHRQLPDHPRDVDRYELDVVVDDLEGAIERVKANGGKVVRGIQDEAFGRSALIADPEGRQLMIVTHD
ncbi:MAG: hypothetical protein IT442_12190 [Phycisphaeraceae bacterium]|nr:hypothetical protein [Phycisphaeraceae bacterium]